MGWEETCAVEERMRFVVAAQKDEESFAALCRRFGVSRRIGYKWLARFEAEGAGGLFDRSRAPLHHPQAIAEDVAGRCLRGPAGTSNLGTSKSAGVFGTKRAQNRLAGGEHDRRAVRSRRADGEAQASSS